MVWQILYVASPHIVSRISVIKSDMSLTHTSIHSNTHQIQTFLPAAIRNVTTQTDRASFWAMRPVPSQREPSAMLALRGRGGGCDTSTVTETRPGAFLPFPWHRSSWKWKMPNWTHAMAGFPIELRICPLCESGPPQLLLLPPSLTAGGVAS